MTFHPSRLVNDKMQESNGASPLSPKGRGVFGLTALALASILSGCDSSPAMPAPMTMPAPAPSISPLREKVQRLAKEAGIVLPPTRPGAVMNAPVGEAKFVTSVHTDATCPNAAALEKCNEIPHWQWRVDGKILDLQAFQAWLQPLRNPADWTKAPPILILMDQRAPVSALLATTQIASLAGLWNFALVDAEGGLAGFYDIRDQRVRGPEVRSSEAIAAGEMPKGLENAVLVQLEAPGWNADPVAQEKLMKGYVSAIPLKFEDAQAKAAPGHVPQLVIQPERTDRIGHVYTLLAAARATRATTILDRSRSLKMPRSIPEGAQVMPSDK